MRITLSERQFSEQIRQLEGLGPEITVEEIQHKIDRYARRLFEHLREYGIQMLPDGFHVSGTLATISAQLTRAWDEESVQTRIQGLALLAPTSISLDQPDLNAFVVNPIILASMLENWTAFGHSLQRISLSELRPALENAAQQLMSAPTAPPTNEFEQEMQQLEYEAFLAAAGKKDPLRKHLQIEAFRQGEEQLYKNAQDEARRKDWENRD